jgi:hypothetical protein
MVPHPMGKRNITSLQAFRLTLGTKQPAVQCALGAQWLGRDADHAPPSIAEVKNDAFMTYTQRILPLTVYDMV